MPQIIESEGPVAVAAGTVEDKKNRQIKVVNNRSRIWFDLRGGHLSNSPAGQRGILPCFFGGTHSRLVFNGLSALINFSRVCSGSTTSSSQPLRAAT